MSALPTRSKNKLWNPKMLVGAVSSMHSPKLLLEHLSAFLCRVFLTGCASTSYTTRFAPNLALAITTSFVQVTLALPLTAKMGSAGAVPVGVSAGR